MSRGVEGVVACVCLDRQVADLEGDIACDDPETFVIPVMHVQGGLGAEGLRDLDDRHLSTGVGCRRLDHGEVTHPGGHDAPNLVVLSDDWSVEPRRRSPTSCASRLTRCSST